jgi:hypothetical protein
VTVANYDAARLSSDVSQLQTEFSTVVASVFGCSSHHLSPVSISFPSGKSSVVFSVTLPKAAAQVASSSPQLNFAAGHHTTTSKHKSSEGTCYFLIESL